MIKAPHEDATQEGALHEAVVAPLSALHVATPDPEYPSAQVTLTVSPRLPAVTEPVASLFDTVKTAHPDATHVGTLHDDVGEPLSAVHVAVPDPEYPSAQVTLTVSPVTPVAEPAASLFETVKAPHDAAAH
jgi:hypothetical protein